MCRVQFLISVIVLSINVLYSWDFAVTKGRQLQFYTDNGKKTMEITGLSELTALTYDASNNMLLFVDKYNDNGSIFAYEIDSAKYQPIVRKHYIYENIQGLAYDPISVTLFWTIVNVRSIFRKSLALGLNDNAYGNLLITLHDQVPRAIAVDSCRGYIYWSNTNVFNPSIERAKFDGTDRIKLINKRNNLYMPVSIAIDQQSRRLYWADDKEGIQYTIQSSDLNGHDVIVELEGTYHQPNSLTVSKTSIYWIDWTYKTLWRLPKHAYSRQEPENVLSFKDANPFSVVANYKIADQTRYIPECQKLAMLNRSAINESILTLFGKKGFYCLHGETVNGNLSCECHLGYIGERCDVSVCHNYCLNGNCSLTMKGEPMCSCEIGTSGTRCEQAQCFNYCHNNAECSIDFEENTPVCKCLEDQLGLRCEGKKYTVQEYGAKCNNNKVKIIKIGPPVLWSCSATSTFF